MTLDKITELYFVTGNPNKIRIYNELMKPEYNIKWFNPPNEIPELPVRSVKEVVADKLYKAHKQFNKEHNWLFVTDVGFYITQLDGGRPGALIKRDTIELGGNWGIWCNELKQGQPRDAYIQIIIAAKNNQEYLFIDNKIQGSVPLKPMKGNYGFDWDEIFVPQNYNSSFAQMPTKLKHKILFEPSILEFKYNLDKCNGKR